MRACVEGGGRQAAARVFYSRSRVISCANLARVGLHEYFGLAKGPRP